MRSYQYSRSLHLVGDSHNKFQRTPDDNDQINVNVYSLVDPAEICIQVLEKFESNIPLGSYSSGNYTVLVNGEPVGEINP